jgi:c-di-GMP-binding flagellar brake protein YcgR
MEQKILQSERRKHKRISFIKDMEVGEGLRRSLDLSVGGMYLETVSNFSVGSILDLRFKLKETDHHIIQTRAKVLYEHTGIGIGLCFMTLSSEDRENINQFVARN